ncbi:exodeoxyribonuclease VII small subunit [Tissierellaceae bacterium HCP3S3_D8]
MKYENLSYEEALEELQNILDNLENGEHTLSESVDMFKNGIELYTHCNNILSKTDGEIKILLESEDSLIEEDFLKEADDYY